MDVVVSDWDSTGKARVVIMFKSHRWDGGRLSDIQNHVVPRKLIGSIDPLRIDDGTVRPPDARIGRGGDGGEE